MSRTHRDIRTWTQAAGLVLQGVEKTGGGHLRVRAKAGDGRIGVFFFFASTAGDKRSSRNAQATLRRFARGGEVGGKTH